MKADVQVLELPALPQQRPAMWWRPLWLFIKRKPLGAIGAGVLSIFVVMAILAPALATHEPDLNDYRARVKPPSAQHWVGTDNFGRDMYSRVVVGARISIYVGVLSTLLGTARGLAGLLSGFGAASISLSNACGRCLPFPWCWLWRLSPCWDPR
jgi:ABC-type dipeptide/oligopeptide/nickel transport system permease subunit